MFLFVSGDHICAPQRDTDMVYPYKALLQIWVKRFYDYLEYELSHTPVSWRGFLLFMFFIFPDSGLSVLTVLHFYS